MVQLCCVPVFVIWWDVKWCYCCKDLIRTGHPTPSAFLPWAASDQTDSHSQLYYAQHLTSNISSAITIFLTKYYNQWDKIVETSLTLSLRLGLAVAVTTYVTALCVLSREIYDANKGEIVRSNTGLIYTAFNTTQVQWKYWAPLSQA